MIYPVLTNGILESWKGGFKTWQGIERIKTRGGQRDVCMANAQRSIEGGLGIYKRGFPRILWEAQLGIRVFYTNKPLSWLDHKMDSNTKENLWWFSKSSIIVIELSRIQKIYYKNHNKIIWNFLKMKHGTTKLFKK